MTRDEDLDKMLLDLAVIVSRGLSPEQRLEILRQIPITLERDRATDHLAVYIALLQDYQASTKLDYVPSIIGSLEKITNLSTDMVSRLAEMKQIVETHRIGRPKEKPYVFVLLPLDPEFLVIYQSAIKPTLQALGCEVEHAKELHTIEQRVVTDIVSQIKRASLIVADVSGQNPNVYYEIGWAHALDKWVILLAQKQEDISFDIYQWRRIRYSPLSRELLAEELRKAAAPFLERLD